MSEHLSDPSPHCTVTILRLREVLKRISVSRSTLLRSVARGDFPRPVLVGKRCRGWIEADILHWLNQRRQSGDGIGAS
jgi:prophage regulatory protein